MADPPADSDSKGDTGDDTGVRPDGGPTTNTPRWVKVFGIIVIVLVLLIVIMMVFGGGDHGPGRHGPSDSPVDHTPAIEHGFQWP